MDLVRWNDRNVEPVDAFDWLQREINELFDFPRFPETAGLFDRRMTPAVDVIEHPDRYVVTCDLPGMKEEDIEVTVASGLLTIKGEKRAEEEKEDTKVYRKETWEGSFQRTLTLPEGVNADKVDAEYKDGVLRITLPKREEAKTKRIPLKTN